MKKVTYRLSMLLFVLTIAIRYDAQIISIDSSISYENGTPMPSAVIPAPSLPVCPGTADCNANLICFGDFEGVVDPLEYSFFLPQNDNTPACQDQTIDIYTLYSSPYSLEWREHYFNDLSKTLINTVNPWNGAVTTLCANPPNPITVPSGNSFLGFAGRGKGTTCDWTEGVHFRLRRTLNPKKTYTLKFWARKTTSNCPNFTLEIRGSSMAPDHPNTCVTWLPLNNTSGCTYVAQQLWTQQVNTSVWTEYSITINPNTASNFNNLVLTIPTSYNVTPTYPTHVYGYFDDFRLVENEHTITTTYVPSCGATTIIPTVSGGVPPYTYRWDDNSTAKNRINTFPGAHWVIVTDDNGFGCAVSHNVFVSQAPPINIVSNIVNPRCKNSNNGSINVTVTSGKAPFTYNWSNGSTSNSISGLIKGTYTITVADNAGCNKVESFTLQESAVDFDLSIKTNYNCSTNNMGLSAHAKKGQPSYSYQWSSGHTSEFISSISRITYPTISLTVTDALGCKVSATKKLNGIIDVGTGTSYPMSSLLNPPTGPLVSVNDASNLILRVIGTFEIDNSQNSTMMFKNTDFLATPGSRIRLDYNAMYANGCNFYSCTDTLWKGIENPTQNGALSISNCTIQDAQYGIESMDRGSTYNVRDNDFINNFVGIFYPPLKSTGSIYSTRLYASGTVYENTFIGSGTSLLKKPFKGMTLNTYYPIMPNNISFATKSWAGIIATDFDWLKVNDSKFSNLCNGLLSYNTNFSVHSNNNFKNILNYNNWNTGPRGVAYYFGANNPSLRSRIQIINGSGNSSTTDIYNCLTGVHNDFYQPLDIRDLIVNKAVNGVIAYSNEFSIEKSTLQTSATALSLNIGMSRNPFNLFLKGQIIDNYILLNATSDKEHGIYFGGVGQYLKSWGDDYQQLKVKKNRVLSLGASAFAIKIDNIQHVGTNSTPVGDNTVDILAPASSEGGILYQSNIGLWSMKNTVNGASTLWQHLTKSNYPIGIYYANTNGLLGSPANRLECNIVSNIYTGTRFSGTSTNSNFRMNSFNTHMKGLWLDGSTSLNKQSHASNIWTGTYLNQVPSGLAAAISEQSTLNRTRFEATSPESSWQLFWPSSRTALFFYGDPSIGDNRDCTAPLPFAVEPPRGEAQVLNGTQEFPSFSSELKLQNEMKHYQDLLPYRDSFADSSLEKTFLDNLVNSNLSKFVNLKNMEFSIHNASSEDEILLTTWRDSITYYRNALIAVDSIPIDVEDTLAFNARENEVNNYLSQLHTFTDMYDTFSAIKVIETDKVFDSILTLNSNIVTTHPTEVLQKQYNEVYYASIARGIDTLTETQFTTYSYIANQCSKINADVVFKSRSVLRAFGDTTYFFDDLICEGENYVYPPIDSNALDTTTIECTISPNPSEGIFNIDFTTPPNKTIEIFVISMTGHLVFQESSLITSNIHSIDLSSLNTGIYALSIRCGNLEIKNEQIIIQR